VTAAGNIGARDRSRWRLVRWNGIASLLLLPLIAMRCTDQVRWTVADFAVAFVLLVGAGTIYEALSATIRATKYRPVVGAALVAVVALIWAQGAVGVI
jgi:hypothetical protein